MQLFNKINYLILIIFFAVMTGCSGKNEEASPEETTGNQLQYAGDPHTYDFTITGGIRDGERLSGEIENDLIVTELMLANYSAFMNSVKEKGQKNISLHISKSDVIIGGAFFYKDGTIKDFGAKRLDEFSELSFQLEGPLVKYSSVSGTVELSEVDFTNSVGINEVYNGLAAYKITFDGTFKNVTDGQEVTIKGTVKVNFPKNVEQY